MAVTDCTARSSGGVSSHFPVRASLRVALRLRKRRPRPTASAQIDWLGLRDQDKKDSFQNLIAAACPSDSMPYSEFTSTVNEVAETVLVTPRTRDPPWFHLSREILLPLISARNEAQRTWKSSSTDPAIHSALASARSVVKKAVRIARLRWLKVQSKEICKMNVNPRQVWLLIEKLRKGLSYHHTPPSSSMLRRKDGSITASDKEYVEALRDHFATIFSRLDIPFDPTVLDAILQRQIHWSIDDPPTLEELLAVLREFNNHKAPGENGLTADALKALAQKVSAKSINEPHAGPIRVLLKILRDVWLGADVPAEWHSGCLYPIFKKGDLLIPANWRPVCLLDIS